MVILSGARCRLAYAQLMPPPLTVSCFSKIQIGFTFLVPAHPGSPGKRAVKRVCVCVVWQHHMHKMQRCGLLLWVFPVCVLDITTSCVKTVGIIRMVFGMWTQRTTY